MLAESAAIESTLDVPIRPWFGMVSMARSPLALPSVMPLDMRRAAVRCAMLMPSPIIRITFFATGFSGVAKIVQSTTLVVVPSLTSTLYLPGLRIDALRSSSADALTSESFSRKSGALPRTLAAS